MVSTSLVTRSAAALEMDIPSQIVIKPSKVDPDRQGVWCKEIIKEGTKFGPFVGEKAYEVDDSMDPAYIWEIVDIETKEFLFYINATNPHSGNWMRHIKCARFYEEQNIVSEQEGIDIFYQAIKDIMPGDELLTWFEKSPLRRKKGKRRIYPHIKRAKTGKPKVPTSRPSAGTSKADAYADVNYVSQRGRKRSVKKYWQMEAESDPIRDSDKPGESEDEALQEVSDEDWMAEDSKLNSRIVEKPTGAIFPVESSAGFFQFELHVAQTSKNRIGRKVFQCDICCGIYRHSFSLKRHYIRNHINYKYVSKVDRLNCSIAMDAVPLCDDEQRDESCDAGEGKQDDETSVENGKEGIKKEQSKKDSDEDAQNNAASSKKKNLVAKDNRLHEKASVGAAGTESMLEQGSKEEKSVNSKIGNGTVTSSTKVETAKDDQKREGNSESTVKHNMPGLYRCNICERLYDSVDELKEHILNHPSSPNDKKFSCQHCKMKFQHRQNLVRHEVVHTGAKPYICNHCHKRFPTLTNQKRHERIHKGQKFTCSQCPGTFTQTGDLKKHMCKQHPETYNECGYCSKYFSSEAILSGHLQKVHNKDIEANHQKICARKKARKINLEKDRAESRRLASDQMENHSRSDPSLQFACTICRKRFRDYSNMCRHRRLAHEREASNLEAQWGNSDEGTLNDADGFYSDSDSQPDGEKMSAMQIYFSHVTQNISNNLQNFIDGKEEQLSRASSHIRWRQKNMLEKLAAAEKATDINLEDFNFPRGFQIRPLSELYESLTIESQEPLEEAATETVEQNSETVVSDSCEDLTQQPENSSKCKEVDTTTAIRIPEIKSCSLCHSNFQNTAAFINHMSEVHGQKNEDKYTVFDELSEDCTPLNYSTKSGSEVENEVRNLTVCTSDQPLDLSANSVVVTPPTPAPSPTYPDAPSTIKPETTTPVSTSLTIVQSGSSLIVSDASKRDKFPLERKHLCLVCFGEFPDVALLIDHQREHHANIDCRHVEVDKNFNTPWIQQPNAIGALKVSSSQLPQSHDAPSLEDSPYVCTKCKNPFASSELLHQHIAECGDYWRQLNNRVTWVFVLRGSELPMEKVVKKRGKFHWSNSPEESSRKQLQRMLLQQHLGENPSTEGVGVRGRFGRTISRHKSFESLDNEADLRRNRWRHGHQSVYNPRRHVRRREMAELVDVQRCRGCGELFKTILQLERHIPVCAEKNRIKDLHAEKTENGENSDAENDYDPSKHMCIYCERQFTYLRMLKKHISENCTVRKDFVEKGEYIDEEWETEISSKVQNSSRDSSQNCNETMFAEEADNSVDNRKNKRRKRGNNWGCRARTKKSFKSPKSSDDGDSLFGWEDAFLNTWNNKNDGNVTKTNGGAVSKNNENQEVTPAQKSSEGNWSNTVADSSSSLQNLLTGHVKQEFFETEKSTTNEKNAGDQNDTDVASKSSSPKSVDVACKEISQSELPGTCKLEAEECSSPLVTCDSETLQMTAEDVSAVDIKQKLMSKIQSKRNVRSSGEPVDEEISEGKSDGTELTTGKASTELGTDSSKAEDIVKEENTVETVEPEQEEEQEVVQSTRARKRRGPRLTMKSKKRRTEQRNKATQGKSIK